jgi:hypothetical protein
MTIKEIPMNRLMIQAVFCLILCQLLVAQQPTQAASTPATQPSAPAAQPAQTVLITATVQPAQEPAEEPPLTAADLDRNLILKNALTICINSETDFLSAATLDRALMQQRDWEKLGLAIVSGPCYSNPKISKTRTGDLEIQVNRVVFTHIHTYILTDKRTGLVLASGRVRAFDGVVASGPMAEQIVKILSAARLPAKPAGSDRGL